MWSKIKISIIVIFVIIGLNFLSFTINMLDSKYDLQNKFYIPIKCMSTAMCSISGNIVLLWLIYVAVPETYYENILKMLDPKSLHKLDNQKTTDQLN